MGSSMLKPIEPIFIKHTYLDLSPLPRGTVPKLRDRGCFHLLIYPYTHLLFFWVAPFTHLPIYPSTSFRSSRSIVLSFYSSAALRLCSSIILSPSCFLILDSCFLILFSVSPFLRFSVSFFCGPRLLSSLLLTPIPFTQRSALSATRSAHPCILFLVS
jgi:hypothetical protein